MTVSTLDRRAFFQKLRSITTEKKEGSAGVFGQKMSPFAPLGNQELPLVPPPTTTITLNGGLEPYTGPWDFEQAAHLLRRTGFGVKKADLDTLMALTMDGAVDHVLNVVQPDVTDVPIHNYYDVDNPGTDYDYNDPAVTLGQTWVNADYDNAAEGLRTESFRGWWFNLMINEEASIRERMTLFWHNHFATQTEAVFYGKVCYRHNKLLRENALGNFKELTKLVTKDVLMLFYLNGYLNSKNAPMRTMPGSCRSCSRWARTTPTTTPRRMWWQRQGCLRGGHLKTTRPIFIPCFMVATTTLATSSSAHFMATRSSRVALMAMPN
ncbi:MAG: DUF1800 family protein [Saprospiraceae bacterium]|nr:DUF1800 family protein [Saprospiraceae bacterium]